MLILPGYTIRAAEPTEFGEYFQAHRKEFFPDTIDFDPLPTMPDQFRTAREPRMKHRASEYRLRWFI